MPGTLILSAWQPEIAPLMRLRRVAGLRRAGGFTALAVGIGPVDAAVGAARAIAAHAPERVVFVGTAGAYERGAATLAIGDAAVVDELRCVSSAALRGDGFLPEPQVVHATASPRLRAALAAAARSLRPAPAPPVVGVACPLAVTRSSGLGRRIARATGAGLENLEAFAVARAAAAAKLPFAAVLGVANRVGRSGHREWRTHHGAASRAACRLVAAFLLPEARPSR